MEAPCQAYNTHTQILVFTQPLNAYKLTKLTLQQPTWSQIEATRSKHTKAILREVYQVKFGTNLLPFVRTIEVIQGGQALLISYL